LPLFLQNWTVDQDQNCGGLPLIAWEKLRPNFSDICWRVWAEGHYIYHIYSRRLDESTERQPMGNIGHCPKFLVCF